MSEIHKKLYDGRSAGLLYSFISVLPLIFSLLFTAVILAAGFSHAEGEAYPDWYIYCSYLLPQLSLALSVFVFFLYTDASPKKVYKGTGWRYFLLACVMQFGLFSLSEINNLFLSFLGVFGYVSEDLFLPSLEGGGLVGAILVIAVLPAIFEESIFRGLLLGPLKKLSTPAAVLLCGALFSLYHTNPAQTLYQFVCGCAFALVAVRADSVLPTVLSHFLNNAVILILTRLGVGLTLPVYVCSAVALVGSLAWLLFFDRSGNAKKSGSLKPFLITASVGIGVFAVLWMAKLIEGFL